ncbi:MAG: glycine zipper 2TM domain-containing protein [Caulobacteraceae bacterium]|nr:glycine zipper 2TM domain-containing protein [Caulobacteraceae bacterium]
MNKYLKGTIAASAAWFCLSAPAMAQWTPPSIPQPAQAASSWGFLSCAAPGQRQEMGAAIGAVAGGVIGNRVGGEDNQLLGTASGVAVGGLAASWIGCRLQTGDQRRAQEAAQRALAENSTQTWSNPETGASGQVRVMYGSGQTLSNVSFMRGVRVEPRYEQLTATTRSFDHRQSARRALHRFAAPRPTHTRRTHQRHRQERRPALVSRGAERPSHRLCICKPRIASQRTEHERERERRQLVPCG